MPPVFVLAVKRAMKGALPIWEILQEGRHQTYDFEKVVSLLVHRMTSKPSDEPLAIAGLLNVDIGKLDVDGRTDLESRLQALFLEVKTFTAEFLWRLPPFRMERSPGFRWAPTSLASVWFVLPQNMHMKTEPYGNVVCSSQGITTERIVPVLYFADVHMAGDRDDPTVDKIFINDPPREALYRFYNTAPHHHATVRTFNGIVLRSALELGARPEGTHTSAIVVNIVDFGSSKRLSGEVLEDEGDVEEAGESPSPIVCEFVKYSAIVHCKHFQYSFQPSLTLPCRLIMARVTFR